MAKYIGYFNVIEDGETVDDFKEWVEANSKEEAESEFYNDHWRQINSGILVLSHVSKG